MPTRPFWLTDTVALGASASADAVLSVSAGEIARLKRIVFIASGAFSLTGLKDSSGLAFSDASVANPIPSTILIDAATDDKGVQNFEPPLELEGPSQLNLTLLDTSAAANTVRVIAEGEKET